MYRLATHLLMHSLRSYRCWFGSICVPLTLAPIAEYEFREIFHTKADDIIVEDDMTRDLLQ